MAQKISLAGVYAIIKRLIAQQRGINWSDVLADDKLRDKHGYSPAMLRTLLRKIADEIAGVVGEPVTLDPDGIANATTVRELAIFVWNQLPDRIKQ